MASNSSRSISTAPEGRDTPSRRYLSAPQSNSTKSMDRLAGLVAAWSTFTACGVTSAPMPSPGITAMRAAGPPFRKGMPGKVWPPQPLVIHWPGAIVPSKCTTRHQYQVPGATDSLHAARSEGASTTGRRSILSAKEDAWQPDTTTRMKGPGWAKRDKQIDSHRRTIGWFDRHFVSKNQSGPRIAGGILRSKEEFFSSAWRIRYGRT